MNFNKTVKYNLKRVLPILGIAGATLLPACRGHQNEPEPKKEIQKHDVSLYFYKAYYDEITPEKVSEKLADPTVANVYLEILNEDFTTVRGRYIESVRQKLLEPTTNLDTTRVFGRGNFKFVPGVVGREDSLWLVSKGWTVNQQNQR